MGKVRVLIADDSPTALDIIDTILCSDPDIEVVGKARNGREVIQMAETLRPDVITLDINMPVMNGLDAIRHIMAYRPTPILVITSSTDANIAFQSLSVGALEVLEKPELEESYTSKKYEEFTRKIKLIARVKVVTHISGRTPRKKTPSRKPVLQKIIGIVCSTGGPRALAAIFGRLPKNLSAPILVVQHISEGFTSGLVEWLQDVSPLKVKIAETDEPVEKGVVYVADSGKHLAITRDYVIDLSDTEPSNGQKPSGDILFESMARSSGANSIGVILTGMGRDGADGLKEIRNAGGKTIAQNEATSLIFGMPKAAIELDAAEWVLPLDQIADEIVRLAGIDEIFFNE
ncbi:chemotaxis response regulator protein-glutamate methylesterase [bacterium]|nr:chemotaxis response regulator protein-glutamate methylesterase [bacterium]